MKYPVRPSFVPLSLGLAVLLYLIFVTKPWDQGHEVYERHVVPKEVMGKIKFKEVSKEYEIYYQHLFADARKIGVPADQMSMYGVNPSVSVVDINHDGYMDIFIPETQLFKSNLLFINQQGQGFKEQAKEYNLDAPNDKYPSSFALFADFNSDGNTDLLLAKTGCHRLFEGQGPGRPLVEASQKLNGYCSRPHGVNVADFNLDGKLDLVFANLLPSDQENEHKNEIWGTQPKYNNKTGGANHVLLAQEDLSFKVAEKVDFLTRSYTHSVGISDVDMDGWPDVFFANDFSNDQMFLNKGGNSFQEVTDEYIPRIHHGNSGMNAEFMDFNQDGLIDLYVSNIHKPPFFRAYNLLWQKQKSGRFTQKSLDLGVARCGFSWAGKFADFENDGDLDLVVVNGRSKGKFIKKQGDGRSLWYQRVLTAHIPDDLRKLYVTKGEQRANMHLSAFERGCMFVQQDGMFYDVTDDAGGLDNQEGRGLALIDLDNDGRMDFVSVSRNGELKLYKNESEVQGDWLGIQLVTQKGDRIPIGAKVKLVREKAPALVREYYPANGFRAQSDSRLHFGLGKSKIAFLEVQWPRQQGAERFYELKANSYNMVRQGFGKEISLQ